MAQLTAEAVEIYENGELIPAIMVYDFENDYTMFVDAKYRGVRLDAKYKQDNNNQKIKTKEI